MDSSRPTHLAFSVEIEFFFAFLPAKSWISISLAWFGSWESLPPSPLWAKLDCERSLMPRGQGSPTETPCTELGKGPGVWIPRRKWRYYMAQRSREVSLSGENNRYPICLPACSSLACENFFSCKSNEKRFQLIGLLVS